MKLEMGWYKLLCYTSWDTVCVLSNTDITQKIMMNIEHYVLVQIIELKTFTMVNKTKN